MENVLLKREFLNLPNQGGRAYVMGGLHRCRGEIRAEFALEITDCERKIKLHNSIYDKETKKNAIYKLKTLMGVCSELLQKVEEIEFPEKKP